MNGELAILVPPDSMASVGDLVLDLITETQLNSDVTVTVYPREDGTDAADHATLSPRRESLSVLLTDTPAGASQAEPGRARRLLQDLYDLQASLQPVSAATFLYDYGEVLITAVTARHGAGVGYGIPVTIEIEQVQYVEQRIAGIPPEYIDPAVAHSAQRRPSEGERSGAAPTGDESRKASVLHRLLF